MRSLVFVCLILLGLLPLKAQESFPVIDSLEEAAANQKGKERVKTLFALSEKMKDISLYKSVLKAELAEKEAQKTGDSQLIALANLELAKAYIDCYDFDLAEPCLRKALEKCDKNEYELKCSICLKMGYVFLKAGNVDTAAVYYEKTLDAAQLSGDNKSYADAVHNLAVISRNKGDNDSAMRGFEKAVDLYKALNDSLSVARNLNDIALLYLADNQFDKSFAMLSELVPFFERNGEYKDIARSYSNMGLISLSMVADVDTALVLFSKARHFADLANDSLMMVDILLNECDLFLMNYQTDRVFANLEEAEHISKRISYYEGLTAVYVRFVEVYYLVDEFLKSKEYIWLCRETEEKIGAFLYTPLLKPYLMRCYANLGEYDSLDMELTRREEDYNRLLSERQEFEKNGEDVIKFGKENEELKAKVTKLQYVAVGLATLLVALFIYTIISGRPKKEK